MKKNRKKATTAAKHRKNQHKHRKGVVTAKAGIASHSPMLHEKSNHNSLNEGGGAYPGVWKGSFSDLEQLRLLRRKPMELMGPREIMASMAPLLGLGLLKK